METDLTMSPCTFSMKCKMMYLCDSCPLHKLRTMAEDQCTKHSISFISTLAYNSQENVKMMRVKRKI